MLVAIPIEHLHRLHGYTISLSYNPYYTDAELTILFDRYLKLKPTSWSQFDYSLTLKDDGEVEQRNDFITLVMFPNLIGVISTITPIMYYHNIVRTHYGYCVTLHTHTA